MGQRTYTQVVGTGPDQLARMQWLSSRLWNWSSRWHPGELTWFWWENGGPLPTSRIATWQMNEHPVAWAWSKGPALLDLQIDPAHSAVLEQALAWFDTITGDDRQVITVTDAETALIEALRHHGYVPDRQGPFFAHLRLDRLSPQ